MSILFCAVEKGETAVASVGVNPPTALVPQIQALGRLLNDYEKQLTKPYPQWSCTKYSFKKGDKDPVLRTVKKQLGFSCLSYEFDEALEKAIIQFQKQHFLKADGVIGQATCRALNMTFADRIRKIKLNLKRWEKLSPLLKGRCILVNVAMYDLEAMENTQSVLSEDIIVGMKSRQTPLLTTTLTRIILNPSWHVPESIFLKDKLRKIQADPDYLTRNFFVVADENGELVNPHTVDWDQVSRGYLPYHLRQVPGAQNALGQIKFYLEDDKAIYLHGTPQQALFQESARAFSSGCVRLSKPLELAVWALKQTDPKSVKKIQETIAKGETKTIGLPEPIPVYFIYITVWVDKDGQASFSDDPYNKDEAEMKKEGI